MNKEGLHPSGAKIIFNSDRHEYKYGGDKLISVSTLVHSYFPKFNAEMIAQRKAKKDGVTPESLLNAWEKNRVESAAFGTLVHLMAETIINQQDIDAADSLVKTARDQDFLDAVKKTIVKMSANYEFVATEKIVFSPHFKVAGTIDLLLRNKKTGNYVVADWKTAKEIRTNAFGGETGYGPCSSVPNANFYHYSLQQAIYRKILMCEGYVLPTESVSCFLISIRDSDSGVIYEQLSTEPFEDLSNTLLSFEARWTPG